MTRSRIPLTLAVSCLSLLSALIASQRAQAQPLLLDEPTPGQVDAVIDELGGLPQALEFLETATDAEVQLLLSSQGILGLKALPGSSDNLQDCPFRFGAPLRGRVTSIGPTAFTIDARGRPLSAFRTLPSSTSGVPDTVCRAEVGNLGNNEIDAPHPPYQGGHLIGNQLGGWGRRANLAPQNRNLNTGNWVQIENTLARCTPFPPGTISYRVSVGYGDAITSIPGYFQMVTIMSPLPTIDFEGGQFFASFPNEPASPSNGSTNLRHQVVRQLVASGCSRGRTALVIDDTGSMGSEIDGVKIALASFIDQGITLENRDWSLFTFKDDVTNRGTTASRAEIKTDVNAIFPSGGGDCPEQSIGALWAAAQQLAAAPPEEPRDLILVTDADPQPGDYNGLATFAEANDIRIHTLLTGSCGGTATGVKGPSSNLPLGKESKEEPGVATNDVLNGAFVYSTLASRTGGTYRFAPGLTAQGYADLLKADFFDAATGGKRTSANLNLTSMCWLNPTTHRIRVRNPNAYPVAYTWERSGTTLKSEALLVNPNTDAFVEIPGLDINATTTILVRWQDTLGANKSTTKALNKTNC